MIREDRQDDGNDQEILKIKHLVSGNQANRYAGQEALDGERQRGTALPLLPLHLSHVSNDRQERQAKSQVEGPR